MPDRRKRISRPIPILVFGIVFLLLPLVNFVNFAYQLEVPPTEFRFILKNIEPFALLLSFFPIVVGVGILMVKKWGWWCFLLYSIVVILYNILVLVSEPNQISDNIITLVQSVIGFSAMFYFLKPDIAAPYMNVDSRGWRFQKRKPIEIKVKVNSISVNSNDLTSTGLYVDWKNADLELNQEVNVEFTFGDNKFQNKAGVVRIEETGVGLAFRGADRKVISELRKWVEKQEVV
jgi:hypothetical protein